ncbi:MAG TPA: nucleotide disphospho-sugar-binding domain-containing protein [Steroidobacteraceae bacterium]
MLPTLGSAGDVHPMIALGIALRRRAHRVTIITSAYFQPVIEKQGLEFLPAGTMNDFEAAIADPDLWHPRRGFAVVARRAMVPAIEPIFRLIETHADDNTVVAASGICLGARVAQEKLGVPTASVHLQPSIIRSLVDQGMMGNFRISASQPLWFKRAFFRLLDWAVIDRELKRPLNEFRATLGLAPVERLFRSWVHSPQCVIGFFPNWFAAAQPDWPPHTHLVGFPLWDGDEENARLSSQARRFLKEGEPPVIFTPGSAAASMQRFFQESVEAACKLGLRAMLVTNFPGQLPRTLPSNIEPCGYLPFSQVLPRAKLLVYHGGIGTLAQTIKAGIPHLVVPNSHDQFDNAWRIEQLGLGRTIGQPRYRAADAASLIQAILKDDGLRRRCHEYAVRIDSNAAVTRACELIEGLASAR